MNSEIEYACIEQFQLDRDNPRLGRNARYDQLDQERILEIMSSWSLDELARSFIENGFWTQEALLCIKNGPVDDEKLIVIEGNRRVAALINLQQAFSGSPRSRKWSSIVEGRSTPENLFSRVPYILLEKRDDVDAFLGFRHVTGIKEWRPAEKAEYIAYLIDKKGMNYTDVMRSIGSKTETVRRNYLAFSILKQMETQDEIDVEMVEGKFSVLFLSLRTKGVQDFLGLDLSDDERAPRPISTEKLPELVDFSKWLFGTKEQLPLVSDSRQMDRFSIILSSEEALDYLRKSDHPNITSANRIAGGEEQEIFILLEKATHLVEDALSALHAYSDKEQLKRISKRLVSGVKQIKNVFDINDD